MALGHAKSATFLLEQIASRKLDAHELTPHQRKLCLRLLLDEKPEATERQIAQLLGTSHSAIARYKHQIIDQDKWIVDKMDPRWYACHLRQATRARIKKLEQKEKWEAAHKLEMDLADKLMELGILDKAPVKFEGQVTLLELYQLANRRQEGSYPKDSAAQALAGGNGRGMAPARN